VQIIFAHSSPIIWHHICKEINLNHFVLKNSWSLDVVFGSAGIFHVFCPQKCCLHVCKETGIGDSDNRDFLYYGVVLFPLLKLLFPFVLLSHTSTSFRLALHFALFPHFNSESSRLLTPVPLFSF